MVDAVAAADTAVLFAVIPRVLADLKGVERDAFETALARRGFGGYLRAKFHRFDETKKVLACELLAALGGERSVAFLSTATSDPSFRVRIAAAIALAERGEVADVAACISGLGKKARRSSRMVQMLSNLLPGREAEVRAFAEDSAHDPFVRVSALRALAAKGGCDDDLLLRLSGDVSPVVVAAVGSLSVEYRYRSAPNILERMLSSRSPAVRREAALCSQNLGGFTLASSLKRALRDRDPLVASAVSRALVAGIPKPAGLPPQGKSASLPDPAIAASIHGN